MSRIGSLDMTCVMDFMKDCDGCCDLDFKECEDMPTMCCMDSMKECDGCWNC